MKKSGKIAAILMCAALSTGLLSGCAKPDTTGYVTDSKDSSSDSQQEETTPQERITSNGAWTSMKFTLDGEEMVMSKLKYSKLVDMGWSFDPVIYGLDKLEADPGNVYQRSVYLEHDNIDDATMVVGFTNFGDKKCGLDDIGVWSLEIVKKDKTKYPDVVFEGGITWGSDEEAIKKAYGDPSATTRNDNEGYTELIYTDNNGKTIYFDLYDGAGIERMIFESFA